MGLPGGWYCIPPTALGGSTDVLTEVTPPIMSFVLKAPQAFLVIPATFRAVLDGGER